MTGALDRFNDRGTLLHNVEMMLSYIKEVQAFAIASQDSLFASAGGNTEHPITLEKIAPVLDAQKLIWEKELLGVYVSGHPLDAYAQALKKRPTIASVRADEREGIPVVVAGMIEESREIMTKKGDRMAFITIGDKIASLEAVLFPSVLAEKRDLCLPQKCVALKGRLSHRNGEPSIVVEAIKELERDVISTTE